MKPILEVSNISKKFKIYHEQTPYLSIRDSLSSLFKKTNKETEEFWALKEVSFNVYPGDSIGIVGKNGAGKSTLLKILSKITPPSTGKIVSRGRIASMLEVGTGFHPELTGRENIFLNGAILGMSRAEIKFKFDEIVDFSGVEKFLDTPLKHYSSGMQLRLAFSVSAHLDPEILVIDEVLSVGDSEFQKKCIGKMGQVSSEGRTILFVSHNMAVVKNLCKRGILIENGKCVADDHIQKIVDMYEMAFEGFVENIKLKAPSQKSEYGYATEMNIIDSNGAVTNSIAIGTGWKIRIHFTILNRTPHFIIGLGFRTPENINIRTTWSAPKDMLPGDYIATFREDNVILGAGKYKLTVGLSSREQAFHFIEDCGMLRFENYVDKSISLKSDIGIILNPMEVEITKE